MRTMSKSWTLSSFSSSSSNLKLAIVSLGTNTVIAIAVRTTTGVLSNLAGLVLSLEHGNEVEDSFANISVSASCEIHH